MAFDRKAFRERAFRKALENRKRSLLKDRRKGDLDRDKKTSNPPEDRYPSITEARKAIARSNKLKEKTRFRAFIERLKNKTKTSLPLIKEKARKLKERIARLKKILRENEMNQAADPTQTQVGVDPLAQTQQSQTQLPPEIVAEIQNLASAVQNLLASAGIQQNFNAQGADVNAGIPPVSDVAFSADNQQAGMQQQTQPVSEAAWRRKLKGASIEEKIALVKNRIRERREALRKARKAIFREQSPMSVDTVESIYGYRNLSGREEALHTAGRKLGGSSYDGLNDKSDRFIPKTSAKTWPNVKGVYSKTFRYGEEEENTEEGDPLEESWTDRQVDKYIQKKKLSFDKLLREGFLG